MTDGTDSVARLIKAEFMKHLAEGYSNFEAVRRTAITFRISMSAVGKTLHPKGIKHHVANKPEEV